MASQNYTNLPRALALGQINFSTDTFKVLLHTSVPTEANLDAWDNRASVTNEVTAGNGYTAGGFACTASVSAKDTVNNRVSVTFSTVNPVAQNSTISAAAASIYKSTGTAANDTLVAMVDFGGVVASSNGDFSISFTNPLYINA